MGHAASLPRLIVAVLSDTNRTVQGAALASIADLVRAGPPAETARQFWGQGARRAEEVNRLLQTPCIPTRETRWRSISPTRRPFLKEVRGDPRPGPANPKRRARTPDSGRTAIRPAIGSS